MVTWRIGVRDAGKDEEVRERMRTQQMRIANENRANKDLSPPSHFVASLDINTSDRQQNQHQTAAHHLSVSPFGDANLRDTSSFHIRSFVHNPLPNSELPSKTVPFQSSSGFATKDDGKGMPATLQLSIDRRNAVATRRRPLQQQQQQQQQQQPPSPSPPLRTGVPALQPLNTVQPLDDHHEVVGMSDDLDIDDIKPENILSLDPHARRVASAAAQEYKSRPRRGYARSRTRLPPSSVRSSTNNGDDVSDEDAGKYCCNEARLATERNYTDVDFCPGCQAIFCASCWERQISHKGRGTAGHERTSPTVARWVSATLEDNADDDQQAMQHLYDNSTALWFGAGLDDQGVAVFRDFGRYGNLMSSTRTHQRIRRSPALVAFVGETGAGKSSLIKLLISMFDEASLHQTPIVGSTMNEDAPTSGEVHLYSDPNTMNLTDPVLYADCEGLNGGTRDPVATKYRKRRSSNLEVRQTQAPGLRMHIRQAYDPSEREIIWASTPEKSSRDYFVRHLYPRLLYTFSDVIVFVVKNARAIENVIEQLIIWSDAVLEASSNQPVLPHAIIVLNASDNRDESLWDTDISTRDLLKKVEEAMETNQQLKKYAQSWRNRGVDIRSVEQLLLSYYSSVRVVRVPTRDQPKNIHRQVGKLYEEIRRSTKKSLEFKLSVRMKLSAEELQPYLQTAFDHFCHTLNRPFDFVKASYANCVIPSDLGGNILKLSLSIMEHWKDRLDGPLIFKELSFMLASCVMLDAVRRGLLGWAEKILPRYIMHFDEALEDFCDRYWPCEYVCGEGRCVNVRAGHSKGHQLASARIIEPKGTFQSSFTASSYRQTFLDGIFRNLEELLHRLVITKKDRNLEEGQAAIEIHKSSVLEHFYRHIGGAEHFTSHSVCLGCLVSTPQHYLPCGHILCTPCLEAFGQRRGQCAFDLLSCPLHKSYAFDPRWTVSVHPETAGVRILTLDGGGIRGIMELVSLQEIERALGGVLRVQSFFDLIVGTSTGGIIALGIGEKNWRVDDSVAKFMSMASKVFAQRRKFPLSAFDMVFTMARNGKYDTDALENVLEDQFGSDRLFGGLKEQALAGQFPRPKVAVTATNVDGNPYVFANYNRPDAGEYTTGYEFARAERSEQEIKTWEAARATSAAPKIFRPFEHLPTKQSFTDGGIYYNNPIEVAMQEMRLAFPDVRNREPDIVVALGTGIGVDKTNKPASATIVPSKGPLSFHKHLMKIATDHLRHSMESERTWEKFLSNQKPDARSRFFRINFPLDEKCPKLDDVSRIHQLREVAVERLSERRAEIKTIADRLIASSFYFRPSCLPRRSSSGGLTLEGYIECRFPANSEEIVRLGDLLLERQSQLYNSVGTEESLSFVFQEHRREKYAKQVFIPRKTLMTMKHEGVFSMKEQQFVITNHLARIDLFLVFGQEDYQKQPNSISGFPGCWDIDSRPSLRPSLSLSKKRTQHLQRQKPEWSKPANGPPGALESYARNDFPGLASQSDISKISHRLTEPATPTTPTTPTTPSKLSKFSKASKPTETIESVEPLEKHPAHREKGKQPRRTKSVCDWLHAQVVPGAKSAVNLETVDESSAAIDIKLPPQSDFHELESIPSGSFKGLVLTPLATPGGSDISGHPDYVSNSAHFSGEAAHQVGRAELPAPNSPVPESPGDSDTSSSLLGRDWINSSSLYHDHLV